MWNKIKGIVQFAQDAEVERVQREQERREKKWELFSSTSLVSAVHYARDNGWADKKVQVRLDGDTYYVEPYEKDCGCRSLLRYNDYFLDPYDLQNED